MPPARVLYVRAYRTAVTAQRTNPFGDFRLGREILATAGRSRERTGLNQAASRLISSELAHTGPSRKSNLDVLSTHAQAPTGQ